MIPHPGHRLMAYEKSNGKLRLWIMEKLKAMMRTALYRRTFKKFTRTIMQQVQAAEELWEVDEELELLWNVVMDSEDKIGNNTERGMTTLAAPLLFGFVQTIFCKEKH